MSASNQYLGTPSILKKRVFITVDEVYTSAMTELLRIVPNRSYNSADYRVGQKPQRQLFGVRATTFRLAIKPLRRSPMLGKAVCWTASESIPPSCLRQPSFVHIYVNVWRCVEENQHSNSKPTLGNTNTWTISWLSGKITFKTAILTQKLLPSPK